MFITVISVGALLGVFAGILAGILGIGGGLIIVPALVYLLPLLNVPHEIVMPMALATSLASIIFTSLSAMRAHHKNGNILWSLAQKIIVPVAVGSLTGVFVAEQLSADALRHFFAVAVTLLALYMLNGRKKMQTRELPSSIIVKLLGYITGTLASLMGIAGGAILIPLLSFFGVNMRHAIGVATVCGAMVASFATIGFVVAGIGVTELPAGSLGYVYLPILVAIIITSSICAPIGVKLAKNLPIATLKKAFAITLILVAIKMMTH